MNRRQSDHPRVSVVIPLFRSSRFVDTVAANVESLPRRDVEIVISDRHCDDDAIDRLSQRFAADPRVRCLKHRDRLDWVGHINALLGSARGDYWRFLPHDDLSPPGSMEALIAALDDHPEALLAYGPTQAIDGDGRRLPDLDRPAPHPGQAGQGWTLGLALQMFWMGHFDGAFKGLIRRRESSPAGLSGRPWPGSVAARSKSACAHPRTTEGHRREPRPHRFAAAAAAAPSARSRLRAHRSNSGTCLGGVIFTGRRGRKNCGRSNLDFGSWGGIIPATDGSARQPEGLRPMHCRGLRPVLLHWWLCTRTRSHRARLTLFRLDESIHDVSELIGAGEAGGIGRWVQEREAT